MGHCADCRYAVVAVGDSACRCAAAADIGRAGAQNSCIVALCAAGTKLHNQPVAGCTDHAVCFGGYQRLMVDGQQDHRLHQLCLNHRTFDGDNWLIGENRSSLLHCPNVALKVEVGKIIEEPLVKYFFRAEIGDVLFGKAQILQVMYHLLKTCKDGKTAVVRDVAEKHIEHRDSVLHSIEKITIGHGKLIIIGQHGKISIFCPVDVHLHSNLSVVILLRPGPANQVRIPIVFPKYCLASQPLFKTTSPASHYQRTQGPWAHRGHRFVNCNRSAPSSLLRAPRQYKKSVESCAYPAYRGWKGDTTAPD